MTRNPRTSRAGPRDASSPGATLAAGGAEPSQLDSHLLADPNPNLTYNRGTEAVAIRSPLRRKGLAVNSNETRGLRVKPDAGRRTPDQAGPTGSIEAAPGREGAAAQRPAGPPGAAAAQGPTGQAPVLQRAAPEHCPFCAGQDLRPYGETLGAWHCRTCLRVFSVRFLGLEPAEPIGGAAPGPGPIPAPDPATPPEPGPDVVPPPGPSPLPPPPPNPVPEPHPAPPPQPGPDVIPPPEPGPDLIPRGPAPDPEPRPHPHPPGTPATDPALPAPLADPDPGGPR